MTIRFRHHDPNYHTGFDRNKRETKETWKERANL